MQRIVRTFTLGCIFATGLVPLVWWPYLWAPYVSGRAYALRLLVDLAFLGMLILKKRPPYSRLLVVFILLLAVVTLADARAKYPSLAFFGNYDRMGGWIELFHFFLLFVVASAMLDTSRLRHIWIATLVTGSLGVATVGFVQEVNQIEWGVWREQIFSFMGNPSYLGQYAMLMCFLCAFLGSHPWTPRTSSSSISSASPPSASSLWALNFWWCACGVNILIMLLAQSRGAVVGLVAGAFCCLPRKARWSLVGIASLLAVVSLVVHDPRPGAGLLLPLAERFTDYSDDSRLRAFHEALDGAREHPLLGWGQEHMKLISYQHCSDCPYLFDRAHNLALDWLVSAGVLGMLAWFWLLWAAKEAITETWEGAKRRCLYGFLTAYLVSDMFLFDTMGSYLPLIAVMAVSVPLTVPLPRKRQYAQPRTTLEYYLGF